LLSWLALGMFVSSLMLTLPFWFAGEELLTRVFGAEFGASASALHILAAGVVVSAWFGPSAALLNMTEHAARVARASAVAVGTLLLLAVVLVPLWGEVGAAAAVFASITILGLLMWVECKGLLGLDASPWAFVNERG
jgi:O-antigen/teichoic acid export membrane protein